MNEKLKIKVFVGDNPNAEDFAFSNLELELPKTKTKKVESFLPPSSNSLFFSSVKEIPYKNIAPEEQIQFLTDTTVFTPNMSQVVVNPKIIPRVVFNHNILTVLYFLFPYYFNTSTNIHNSFDDKIPHGGIEKINAPILKNSSKVGNTKNGLVHYKGNTVVSLVWKNDVHNIPEFKELFDAIYEYFKWSKLFGLKTMNETLLQIVNNLVADKSVLGYLTKAKANLETLQQTNDPGKKQKDENLADIIKILNNIIKSYKNLQTDTGSATNEKEINEIVQEIDSLRIYDEMINSGVGGADKYGYANRPSLQYGNIVKDVIEKFKNITSNRSTYNVLNNNEFFFKSQFMTMNRKQQDVYDKLSGIAAFTKMVSAIDTFRNTVLQTFNPDLDGLCKNFFNNTDRNLLYFVLAIRRKKHGFMGKSNPLEKFFEEISVEIKKQEDHIPKLSYVGGITRKEDKHIVIYVGLDVIKGRVTEKNEAQLKKCKFKNENLGGLFLELTDAINPKIVRNYTYDVIPGPFENNRAKVGGKTRRKKHFHHWRREKKTRRHFYS